MFQRALQTGLRRVGHDWRAQMLRPERRRLLPGPTRTLYAKSAIC